MAPKLYCLTASPPVRSVLMCAKAVGINLELVPVNLLEGEQLKSDFLKINPQHTIPVLEEDEDFILCDSHAIMAYLVAEYSMDESFYPPDSKQRAIIDHRLFFDSGILYVRGSNCSNPLIYKDIQPTQEKLDELRDAFKILDQILANSKTEYVAGENLTIADFSIITSVTSFSSFVPYTDFPNLKAYITRMEKIPYYEINKEGLALYQRLVSSKLTKK